MNYMQLQNICRMSQTDLKKYVRLKLKKRYSEVVSGDGYVFAKGTFPVLLVAHLDTVHKELPKRIVFNGNKMSSPQGIGGDDRCGIYAILQLMYKHDCSILFCEDEEIGCVGTRKFIDTELASTLEFNYIIELDRKGKTDAVFYECDNPEFEEFITKEYFKTSYGTLSDISYLAPELGCAAVNLSCGYYNAHTVNEYIMTDELDKTIEQVDRLLARTTDDDKFEYIESEYGWYDWYGYRNSSQNNYSTDLYYIMYLGKDGSYNDYEIYASTLEEAVGTFLMDYPHRCFADLEVYRVDDDGVYEWMQ